MRNCLVHALTLAVIGAFASAYGYSSETMAFYPFTDKSPGSSAVGTGTIKNAVDAGLYPADAAISSYSANGEVKFDFDAPGAYVFDDIDSEMPEPICTNPGSIHITGRSGTAEDGGYVSFKGLAGAFARQLAVKGEGTFEFFMKIPAGEAQREWTRGMMLYGGYTVASTAYDHLFVIAPYTRTDQYSQNYAFCYGTWTGSTLKAPSAHNNEWHHIAIVYKGGKFQMFYDYSTKGSEFACTVANPADPSTLAYEIGCGQNHSTSGNHGWRGKVSCLKFTAKALDASKFMRVSDSPHYYANLPEKANLGEDTIAFYPFAEGIPGTTAVGSSIFDVAHPGRNVGTATLSMNGAVDYDADAPGPYVFTNFSGGASAVYTNPASIRFTSAIGTMTTNATTHVVTTNWASGNISFVNIATLLSEKSACTLEFFWKIEGAQAEPNWKPTVAYDVQPVGCTGLYECWLPLSLSPTADENTRRAVWVADVGDFNGGIDKRITYSYPSSDDICGGLWHHFALTYSNGFYRLYCDYKLGNNVPNLPSTFQTESKPLMIGLNAFHGKISCVKVTGRALQPSEMLHASARPDCFEPSSATVRWRFEEGTSGASLTTVSNAVSAYADSNPDVYISSLMGRGDGVVVSGADVRDPAFSASVWKSVIREAPNGRLLPNTLGASLEAATLKLDAVFAEGAGFRSTKDQLVAGSFTAEFFAKLDYAGFQTHVASVSTTRPRVALMTHAISGLNNGAWNLYLDQLTSAPVVRLYVNYEGQAGETGTLLSSVPTESLRYKWHHFALVYDEENLSVRVYLDGEKIIEKTDLEAPLRVRQGEGYWVGSGGNNNAFDGWIDEVRVSRGVLAPDEFLKGRSDMGLIMLYRPASKK